jgi:hypothetical protein
MMQHKRRLDNMSVTSKQSNGSFLPFRVTGMHHLEQATATWHIQQRIGGFHPLPRACKGKKTRISELPSFCDTDSEVPPS